MFQKQEGGGNDEEDEKEEEEEKANLYSGRLYKLRRELKSMYKGDDKDDWPQIKELLDDLKDDP